MQECRAEEEQRFDKRRDRYRRHKFCVSPFVLRHVQAVRTTCRHNIGSCAQDTDQAKWRVTCQTVFKQVNPDIATCCAIGEPLYDQIAMEWRRPW